MKYYTYKYIKSTLIFVYLLHKVYLKLNLNYA